VEEVREIKHQGRRLAINDICNIVGCRALYSDAV
jgi:hypothetical protein